MNEYGDYDDELRRFMLDPEGKIRKARQQEFYELQQEKQRGIRKHRLRLPIRIGIGALLVGGTFFGVKGLIELEERNSQKVEERLAFNKALTDVEALRINGACADELSAEKEFYSVQADKTRNAIWKNIHRDTANLYGRAAILAKSNAIGCEPLPEATHNLTPTFNVTDLKNARLCAAELRMKQQDPNTVENPYTKIQIEIANARYNIAASLAEKHNIPC